MFDHLFTPLGREATLLGDDLAKYKVDLAGHVGRITTYVEAGFLFQEVADEGGILTEPVLDVNLLVGFTGEGSNDVQGVAKLFSESL